MALKARNVVLTIIVCSYAGEQPLELGADGVELSIAQGTIHFSMEAGDVLTSLVLEKIVL